MQACLCARNTLQPRFNRGGDAVKHVQASSSASKYVESTFPYSGSPSCKACTSLFICHLYRQGGAVKHVQACLSVRKDLESCFQRRGGPVKPVQACL